MDPLSFALAKIRLTSPLIARMYLANNVSIDMGSGGQPESACPFHYIIDGTARLVCAHREDRLKAGDVVFLPRWPDYRIETGQALQKFDILDLARSNLTEQWSPDRGLGQSLIIEGGEHPFVTTLLGGICLFDQPHGGSILDDLPPVIVTDQLGKGTEGLLQAVLTFVDEEHGRRPGYAATVARLLEALLVEALRSWTLNHDHCPGRLRGMNDPHLAGILHRLHAQPGLDWNLAAMAAVAGQSRSKFAAHFKSAMGLSPAAYLRQVRCETAEQRLLAGDTVATVAHDLGYGGSFAFSRAFCQHSGRTPAQFRRWARSHAPERL